MLEAQIQHILHSGLILYHLPIAVPNSHKSIKKKLNQYKRHIRKFFNPLKWALRPWCMHLWWINSNGFHLFSSKTITVFLPPPLRAVCQTQRGSNYGPANAFLNMEQICPFILLNVNEITMPSSDLSNLWCHSLRELYWFHPVNAFQNMTDRFAGLRIGLTEKIRSLKFKVKSLFYLSLSELHHFIFFLFLYISPIPSTHLQKWRKIAKVTEVLSTVGSDVGLFHQ